MELKGRWDTNLIRSSAVMKRCGDMNVGSLSVSNVGKGRFDGVIRPHSVNFQHSAERVFRYPTYGGEEVSSSALL